jgi:hypothetical protein
MSEEACLEEAKAKRSEVIMKMTAATVVNFERNPIAPALPKIVWLAPPKAAPNSAPFPAWRRTIKTRAKQTTTCKIVIIVSIGTNPFLLLTLFYITFP